MPTIGTTAKPATGWHAYKGTSYTQQEFELLTMPERGDVLELAAWVGGYDGSCRVYLCLWDLDGALLASSGPYTVADQGLGGPAGGNIELVTGAITPVRLAAGAQFFVGFDRHVNDGHQVSTGAPGSADHYHARRGGTSQAWPGNIGGSGATGYTNEARRVGAYVADYERVAGGKVYRSGAWADAQAVQVYRSGAWADAEAVQVYRSGAWVDAE